MSLSLIALGHWQPRLIVMAGVSMETVLHCSIQFATIKESDMASRSLKSLMLLAVRVDFGQDIGLR